MSPRDMALTNSCTVGLLMSRSGASTRRPRSSTVSMRLPDLVRAIGTPSWLTNSRTSARSASVLVNALDRMTSPCAGVSNSAA